MTPNLEDMFFDWSALNAMRLGRLQNIHDAVEIAFMAGARAGAVIQRDSDQTFTLKQLALAVPITA